MTSLTYDDALARLFGVRERGEDRATALCPAHDDHNASLSVSKGADGKLLLKCHRGCTFEEIVSALNGTPPDPATSNGHAGPKRRQRPRTARHNVVKRWFPAYHAASGRACGTHGREDFTDAEGKPDKAMWWEELDCPLAEVALWNARALKDRPYGSRVYLVEGELKCDRLNEALRAAGVDAVAVATMTSAGETPCDRALVEVLEYDIVQWPDHDEPDKNHPRGAGQQHMERIAARLIALGKRPRWVHWPDAPPKGDVADFLKAGHSVAEIEDLIGDVPEPSPDPAPDPSGAPDGEEAGSQEEPAAHPREGDEEATGKTYWPGVRRLSEVRKKELRWGWHPYLIRNKANVMEGDPGVGKSLLVAHLTAHETTGKPMKFDTRPGWALGYPDADEREKDPGGVVVLLAGEDDTADTIKPRVEAAGGDPDRVIVLEKVPYVDAKGVTRYRRPRFPTDTPAVLRIVRGEHARLIVVDPITSFLDKDVSPNNDTEIRAALDPLVDGCAAENCTTLITRHINKGAGQSALYRGAGSIGIAGLARSVVMVAEDPDAPEGTAQFVLAHVKANLVRLGATLVFQKFIPEGQPGAMPTIDWIGTSTRKANEVYRLLEQKQAGVNGAQRRERMGHQLSERLRKAVEWLRGEFGRHPRGEGLPSKGVIAQGQASGFSEDDVRKAAAYIKVVNSREGFQGPVFWHYDPDRDTEDNKEAS